MTPEQVLKEQERKLKNLERAKKLTLKVGLPANEISTSRAYKSDGQNSAPTVLEVGIWHEYGTASVPMRSFLRAPFITNQKIIANIIAAQFARVEDGLDADIALNLVGIAIVNISKAAFKTQGYGEWPDIQQSTKDSKGSSGILIDTGLLRNSITWVVE